MESPMHPIYDLRDNKEGLEQMQLASLSRGVLGLKQAHRLVGSDQWWDHIERGTLPIHKVRGTVSGF